MRDIIKGAAIAAGLIGGPLAAEAQDAAPVQTARAPSVDAQLRTQQQQIEQQNARIQQLEDQLRELTSVMTTRVDRVEAQTEAGRVVGNNPGMRVEGPNGRHSMTFVGAVQVTAGAVDQSDSGAAAPIIRGGTDIRRARIGIQGTAYNDFAYQAEIDLAATTGSVSNAARDVWVAYNGFRPFSLTVGNIKPQTGLETSFSDRSNASTGPRASATMATT
jgi:phosphate-selective porin OprO/OprP